MAAIPHICSDLTIGSFDNRIGHLSGHVGPRITCVMRPREYDGPKVSYRQLIFVGFAP